jgi:hypothetical protein
MHLLKAIAQFNSRAQRHRTEWPKLEKLAQKCARFEQATVSVELAEDRLLRIIADLSRTGALSRSDIRFSVSATGSSRHISPDILARILRLSEDAGMRSLCRPALMALLNAFDDQEIRSLLAAHVARHKSELNYNDKSFVRETRVLDGEPALEALAKRMAGAEDLDVERTSLFIAEKMLSTTYGQRLKLAILSAAVTAERPVLAPVFSFCFGRLNGRPSGEYYDAMISPFVHREPSHSVKQQLISKIIELYKDPRAHPWPSLLGPQARERQEQCVSIFRKWLATAYLDLFFDIISATAEDHMFRERRLFWKKYFEAGAVDDFTLVLGPDADEEARRIQRSSAETRHMRWSSLSGALRNQSVLIMRLDDLVIAEWSHRGKIRFWKRSDRYCPRFELNSYQGETLRAGSISVDTSAGQRDGIIHRPGSWQPWAKKAIQRHTGLSI